MTKKIKLLTATALTSIGMLSIIATTTTNGFNTVRAEECNHVGNHYTELSATETTDGTHEYWVCCKCHHHFLSYVEGFWTDNGQASHVDSSDDRYLPSISDKMAGFEYTIGEDGSITITKYTGSDKNVVIPEGVTSIAAGAFKDKDLDSVVLPSTITKIEGNAFKDSGTVAYGRGDDFTIYVNMTEAQFKELNNGKDWNAAYEESPLGWGWLTQTEYAEVVYLPNWTFVSGIPTKR